MNRCRCRSKFILFAILISSLLSDALHLSAQDFRNTKVWAFGQSGGLDFNSGAPVPIKTAMVSHEGVASVTGANGQLLFYTAGDQCRIWDRNHNEMPNNEPVNLAALSTTQAALIVPMPDSSKYYVFTLTEKGGLYYSIVNMRLNGCLGDIEPGRKGLLLDDSLGEKMTAVAGDNCNIWVIVHSRDKPEFKSFEITSAGINRVPVISNSGQLLADPLYASTFEEERLGVIKVSPGRKKLVSCLYVDDVTQLRGGVELHDFDIATGIVSNCNVLIRTQLVQVYGASFSPDNSKLYIATSGLQVGDGSLYQYDITGDLTAIINSRTFITNNIMSDLQIGPDSLIYTMEKVDRYKPDGEYNEEDFRRLLSVIRFPNLPGTACQYTRSAVRLLAGSLTSYGLPNNVPALAAKDTVKSSQTINTCFGKKVELEIKTGRDHIWEDKTICPARTILSSGIYYVGYLDAGCIYHVDTFIVNLNRLPELGYPEKCREPNNKAWFDPVAGDPTPWTYTWKSATGQTLKSYTGTDSDTLNNISTGNYSVLLENVAGCDTTLFFNITAPPHISLLQTRDTLCTGEKFIPAPEYSENIRAYYWDYDNGDGSTKAHPTLQFTKPGSYKVRHSVESTGGCSSDTAIIEIQVYQMPQANAGPDLTIITGDSIVIQGYVNNPGFSIRWTPSLYLSNDTVANPVAAPPVTQTYHLSVTGEHGCAASDEVKITSLANIHIPNAFSPNEDGINDRWDIPGLDTYTNATITVFNRWGQVVYRSTGYNTPWNGKINGHDLPMGTYYYLIDLKNEKIKNVLQGSVTIIR